MTEPYDKLRELYTELGDLLHDWGAQRSVIAGLRRDVDRATAEIDRLRKVANILTEERDLARDELRKMVGLASENFVLAQPSVPDGNIVVPDPLLSPPSFLAGKIVHDRSGSWEVIHLGTLNTFAVSLRHRAEPAATMFVWGCRHKLSKEQALANWGRGYSMYTAKSRPDAPALIEWVDRVCQHRGWKW